MAARHAVQKSSRPAKTITRRDNHYLPSISAERVGCCSRQATRLINQLTVIAAVFNYRISWRGASSQCCQRHEEQR